VWAKDLPVEAVAEAVPAINAAVRADLGKTASRRNIKPAFLKDIQRQLDGGNR
jgi:hypothetical protein